MDVIIFPPAKSWSRGNEITEIPKEGIQLSDINRVEKIKTEGDGFLYCITWKENDYQITTNEANGTQFEGQFPIFPYSMGKLLFNVRNAVKSIPFVAANVL